MSTGAIVMLVTSLIIVWGGLVVALIQLRRHPEEPKTDGAD